MDRLPRRVPCPGWHLPCGAYCCRRSGSPSRLSFGAAACLRLPFESDAHALLLLAAPPPATCPCLQSYSPNPPLMVEVAPETSGGAASFEFDAPGDYFFACQVPGHCDGGGMIVKYTVA